MDYVLQCQFINYYDILKRFSIEIISNAPSNGYMLNTWFHEILDIKQELFVALLDIDEKCRVTNVSYTGVSYTAKLQRFVYKLCNVSYTLRVCIPCLLNI